MNQKLFPKWLMFVTKLQYLSSKLWFRLIIIFLISAVLFGGIAYLNHRDRNVVDSRSMAPNLRKIGLALDQYLKINNNFYPPNLEILSELKFLDRSVDTAGYKFEVADLPKKNLKPDDFVLLEPEVTHEEDSMRFALRADGRVTYCPRTDRERKLR